MQTSNKVRLLYSELATAIQARANCESANPRNTEWFDIWSERIDELVRMLPSGSGIDQGTRIIQELCRPEKIVLEFEFHHINDSGMYDGWTTHTLYVTPSFSGINLKITGRNRNDIKEYLYDTYHYALMQEVPSVLK